MHTILVVLFIHTYLTSGPVHTYVLISDPDLTSSTCGFVLIYSTSGPVHICVLFLHTLLVLLFIHAY